MRCYICDSTDHEVFAPGQLHSTSEMRVCKVCGNVMHTVVSSPESEAKMKEYYRHEYRPAPNISNLITTTNKLGYVRLTLDPLIDKLNSTRQDKAGPHVKIQPLITGDIGCATGYLVNYLRRNGLRATGCELTTTYRRFAEHFYGVPISEELERKHKYDLLTLYHVLEHLPEPDKKLADYVSMLADDGRFFISVPEWFDVLEEASGSEMASFDHLFHTNHINVFSARSLKNLAAKCGLVIESEDHIQYGQTYVFRKATTEEMSRMSGSYENWQEVVDKLKRSKAAIDAFKRRDFKAAVSIWPKFPEAHLKLIMEVNAKEPNVQRDLFMEIKPILGDNHRIMRTLGVWLYQQQQYPEAVQVLEAVSKIRPGADVWTWLGWCYREMGPEHYKRAAVCFHRAAELDPRKWAEVNNDICAMMVKLPSWDEVATERAKDALWRQSGRTPALIDPVMDPEAAAQAKAQREGATA